jgi:hypothetical protein
LEAKKMSRERIIAEIQQWLAQRRAITGEAFSIVGKEEVAGQTTPSAYPTQDMKGRANSLA